MLLASSGNKLQSPANITLSLSAARSPKGTTVRCNCRPDSVTRLPASGPGLQKSPCVSKEGLRVVCGAAVPATSSLQQPTRRPRVAIFLSGGGSNFQAIHAGILTGLIQADIAVVVSDKPGCGGWIYADASGMPVMQWAPSKADTAANDERLLQALRVEHQADFILLAGYLRRIPAQLVQAYKHKMLNIHPALLPAFGGKGLYGQHVHKAVIASGARFSGATVHFVDDEYDTGPILAQAVVSVHPNDTPEVLAARIIQEEHGLYPAAVAALVDGRVTWREDGVPVIWTAQ